MAGTPLQNLVFEHSQPFVIESNNLTGELLIIIATFNERQNLPSLIEEILARLPTASILIVDDSSPDGTGEWATEKAANSENVFAMIRRRERGLGSATLAGFRWGIERKFKFLGTMDADFSHEPRSLADLLSRIKSDEKLGAVLGSRYIRGGRIEGWPAHRRVASQLVNWLARFWLGLKTRDNSSAFRIYRASALSQIELGSIRSQGYGYLEEILLRLQRTGIVIAEVPITFRDRAAGCSKASFAEGIRVIKHIFFLRLN